VVRLARDRRSMRADVASLVERRKRLQAFTRDLPDYDS
jgi:hypothetical protein